MTAPSASRSTLTQDVADMICDRIAGGESLRAICMGDDMPTERTVYRWLDTSEAFCQQYRRARETQGDTKFDEIGDVARQALAGLVEPNAARVFIDAVKWQTSKLAPKKYGDKTETVLTNADGGNLTLVVNRVVSPKALPQP